MSISLASGSYSAPALPQLFRHILRSLSGGAFDSARRLANVRAREAGEVRELALSVERHSPSFASDLYAAAARHESIAD